jgi:glycine oxidase
LAEKVDFIIVGQGLAGSTLAMNLLALNKSIWVIDMPSENNCSRIAAGLFNPITGMGIVETWLAEVIFSELKQFYQQAEKTVAAKFFFPQTLYRPFQSAQEQNNWMAKTADKGVSSFVEAVFTNPQYEAVVKNPFGGILIKQSGHVDTSMLLLAVQRYLIEKGLCSSEKFEMAKLVIEQSRVTYKNVEAEKIVFCTGVDTLSPYFDWLPIRKLKGETLTIELKNHPQKILNKGVYVVPTTLPNLFKAGATYSLGDVSPATTEAARHELTEKLTALLREEYDVIKQEWGIRPTTIDRRPILGAHPKYSNLIIFNGLGTKGVSLAPYFSKQLANWLAGIGEIQREVNINRFNPLYSRS